MPFDFEDFRQECADMNDAELASAKHKYTRLASGSMGSAALSGALLGPFVVFSIAAAAATAANAGSKLGIIESEMDTREQRARTRMRDIFGGFALPVATGGVGHHFSHVANHLISQSTGHALTHTQSMVSNGLDSGLEHASKYGLERALYSSGRVHRICDRCYKDIGSGQYDWHCTTYADFDLCRTCYSEARNCHPGYHTFV